MRIAITIVVILLTCLSQLSANDTCQNATLLTCSQVLTDNLSTATTDPTAPICGFSFAEGNGRWYTIIGTGESITIDPSSAPFLPAIFVYTGDCDNLTCIDDNYDPFLESTFSFASEVGITYFILILSEFAGEEGSFEIEVSCNPLEPNDLCENPIPLTCPSRVSGDLNFASFDIEAPSCGFSFHQGNGIWYSFIGTGQIITLDVQNSFFIPIILVYTQDCDNLDCVDDFYDPFTNPVFSFVSSPGVEYLIQIASELSGNESSFDLVISCSDPASNDLCENPISLTCPSTISGDLTSASFDNNAPTCGFAFHEGNGIWYTIMGTGEVINLEVQNSIFFPIIQVYTQDCNNLDCVDDFYDPFINPIFSFVSSPGVEYLIQIASELSGDESSFDLLISCSDPASNDECITPVEVMCGELISGDLILASNDPEIPICGFGDGSGNDLWYVIEGTGDIITLDVIFSEFFQGIYVYTGSCTNLFCVDDNYDPFTDPTFSFLAEVGTTYLINVGSEFAGESGAFEMQISCQSPPENNDCLGALELICNTTVTADLTIASPEDNPFDCGFGSSGNNGLWYTIEGNGDIITLEIQNSGFLPLIYVYTGDCNNLSCVDDNYDPFLNPSFTFASAQGVEYLILITTESFEIASTFDLVMTCQEAALNNFCDFPLQLDCGSNITGDLLVATPDIAPVCGFALGEGAGLWYTITGNDELITIEVSDQSFDPGIFVYEQGCNDLECIDPFYDPTLSSSFTFLGETGIEYLVRIGAETPFNLSSFSVNIGCSPLPENATCATATPISCDIDLVIDLPIGTSDNAAFNCLSPDGLSVIWYSFVADQETTVIQFPSFGTLAFYDLFQGPCEVSSCIFPSSFSSDEISFPTEIGVEYFIRISYLIPETQQTINVTSCSLLDVEVIPTLSEWSIIILFMLLLISSVTLFKSNSRSLA